MSKTEALLATIIFILCMWVVNVKKDMNIQKEERQEDLADMKEYVEEIDSLKQETRKLHWSLSKRKIEEVKPVRRVFIKKDTAQIQISTIKDTI